MTPRQFALLAERHVQREERIAAMHGVKVEPRTKPTGMGPEVFEAFERAFNG